MPHPDRESFATELRTLRGDLSLRELGRRAACSKSIISDLEHERRSPTPRIARALDKALGARGKLVSLAEAERHAPDGSPAAAAADDLLAEWDDVWRREFLQCTGAALAAGLAAATSRDLAAAPVRSVGCSWLSWMSNSRDQDAPSATPSMSSRAGSDTGHLLRTRRAPDLHHGGEQSGGSGQVHERVGVWVTPCSRRS